MTGYTTTAQTNVNCEQLTKRTILGVVGSIPTVNTGAIALVCRSIMGFEWKANRSVMDHSYLRYHSEERDKSFIYMYRIWSLAIQNL
jgi:hypothetical protein